MKFEIPNWLIILGGAGQIFTALIYPYIRHRVFDWYNDIKKLKPLTKCNSCLSSPFRGRRGFNIRIPSTAFHYPSTSA